MINTPPEIYVFFGMIATGKSTLAKMWAKEHEMLYYNSDVIRKELAGRVAQGSAKNSFGQGIYSSNFSQMTYVLLLEKAKSAIRNEHSVVLDASYSTVDNRQQVIALAGKHNVPVRFVYCSCPEDMMQCRMAKRAKDPLAISDGRWEIYLQQKKAFAAPDHLGDSLITIETSSSPEQLLTGLKNRLGH